MELSEEIELRIYKIMAGIDKDLIELVAKISVDAIKKSHVTGYCEGVKSEKNKNGTQD